MNDVLTNKEDICGNWLQRYTKTPLSDFADLILLTNFNNYLDIFCTQMGIPPVGFDANIIPVAMWLRGFMPGDDAFSSENRSSQSIRALLCDIVDVSLNDVSRLMVLNGYSLNSSSANPEWMMQPIGDVDDNQ